MPNKMDHIQSDDNPIKRKVRSMKITKALFHNGGVCCIACISRCTKLGATEQCSQTAAWAYFPRKQTLRRVLDTLTFSWTCLFPRTGADMHCLSAGSVFYALHLAAIPVWWREKMSIPGETFTIEELCS